jgi:hypothetical protein
MGGNPLTKEDAAKALKKLNAVDVTGKNEPHPTYAVYHNGKVIATTGLRRSPKRDILVPHVKDDLMVNVHFVLGLAHCTKYLNDYLIQRGLENVGPPAESTSEPPTA